MYPPVSKGYPELVWCAPSCLLNLVHSSWIIPFPTMANSRLSFRPQFGCPFFWAASPNPCYTGLGTFSLQWIPVTFNLLWQLSPLPCLSSRLGCKLVQVGWKGLLHVFNLHEFNCVSTLKKSAGEREWEDVISTVWANLSDFHWASIKLQVSPHGVLVRWTRISAWRFCLLLFCFTSHGR